MRLWKTVAVALAFAPVMAFAQYKDPDVALANLARGFGNGDTQAIVSGIAPTDQVMLQFPGLVDSSDFYGRDQAAYLLESLFSKVKPSGFQQTNVRKNSAEGQYHIVASWTIQTGGKAEARELYITLANKNNGWSLVSVRSGSK